MLCLTCKWKLQPTPKPCGSDEFQCHDKSLCIPIEEFCNNEKDCLDGSDEYEDCYKNVSVRLYTYHYSYRGSIFYIQLITSVPFSDPENMHRL